MNKSKYLYVMMDGKRVGTLATAADYSVAFEYSDAWLRNGFSISPFSLPLQKGVFVPKYYETFEGLFGVFSDSLPDGWGRLIVDRLLKRESIEPSEVDSLSRLAITGSSGMGALTYEPENRLVFSQTEMSLDEIADECIKLFDNNESKNLDELFLMGGSSGGARPKVFYLYDNTEWIVKFPSGMDSPDIGVQEYEYFSCAKKCGITVPETHLFQSKEYGGYFASSRFDRVGGNRIHMISASALLETSHRIPNLDYNTMMQLTLKLTGDYEQVKEMFRRMCFNVFAHNRDDHSKNFSFLYDRSSARWSLSPAYDLTFSSSIGGEHATTVDGNGRNPGLRELLSVAAKIKLNEKESKLIAEEIREIVYEDLSEWLVR